MLEITVSLFKPTGVIQSVKEQCMVNTGARKGVVNFMM